MHIDIAVVRNGNVDIYNSVVNTCECLVAVVNCTCTAVGVVVEINLCLVKAYFVIERLVVFLRNDRNS